VTADRRERRLASILIAGYVLYYIYLSLLIPFPLLVNGVLDDSFYYLQVAKNVARGLGSTFDGVEPTNGYHPLWLTCLVPLYKLTGGRLELPLRLGLLLAAVFAVGSLLWVRRILDRAAGSWAAAVGLLVFAWPRFFGQTVNLLETSLLLFLYLSLIGLWLMRDRSGPIALGVVLGLACLARLDTVFLLASLAIFGMLRASRGESLLGGESLPGAEPAPGRPAPPALQAGHRPGGRPGGRLLLAWRNTRFLALPAVLVLPYLVWNEIRFGHLQPISGAMKSGFPHPRLTLHYLTDFPDFTVLLVLGAVLAVRALRASAPPLVRILGVFGLAAALHMLYTLLFMRWGVDRWHYGLLIPIGLLGIPWLAAQVAGRLRSGLRVRTALLLAGMGAAVALQAWSLDLRHGRYLDATRRLALWSGANLPPGSVVAMTDAGVFGYFSGLTTINLDGLINNYRYRDELRSGRLLEYLRQRKVSHFLDQYMVGLPGLIRGDYETRVFHIWYRPEDRVAGQFTLYREDEVRRVQLSVRPSLASGAVEPNVIILWKYRPS
jgi:hypothetical protein